MDRTFYSIEDIKAANSRIGQHFFDASNLRYFRCRVSEDIFPVPGYGAYFVTSEQYRNMAGRLAPRLYTVRHAAPDGACNTIGEFQQYGTGRSAKREALRLSLLDHSQGECSYEHGKRSSAGARAKKRQAHAGIARASKL